MGGVGERSERDTRALSAPVPLGRDDLPRDPVKLARWLIGKRLVRAADGALICGRIVETEAYLADDPASHSFRGLTERNRSMFTAPGHAYVYRIYGMWCCLNVSAGGEGCGAAVLIRAIEAIEGAAAMARRRKEGLPARDLARGPGRLCVALGVGPEHDGLDLCAANGALWLADANCPVGAIGVTERIGITKAKEAPLRFFEKGNACVSGRTGARRASYAAGCRR